MPLEASLPKVIAGCTSTRLVLLSAGGLHIYKKNILYLDDATTDTCKICLSPSLPSIGAINKKKFGGKNMFL